MSARCREEPRFRPDIGLCAGRRGRTRAEVDGASRRAPRRTAEVRKGARGRRLQNPEARRGPRTGVKLGAMFVLMPHSTRLRNAATSWAIDWRVSLMANGDPLGLHRLADLNRVAFTRPA